MLDQFKIFSIVAQTKSFSKAARLLHLSQPAVSSKIQAMEEDLGVKLFTRTSQGVKLTEAGKIAFEYATRFLAMEQSMNSDINRFMSSSHQLTIGSSCTSGNYALPGSISNFKQKFPQANVKLDISNSWETIGKLHKGEIDVAIVDGDVETNHPVRVLDKIDLVFVAANTDKFKRTKLTLKELKTKPFIVREKGAAVRTEMEKLCVANGCTLQDFNVVAEMNSLHSIKAAVLSGTGITLLPLISVRKEIAEGALRILQIEGVDLQIDVNLVYPIDEESSPLVQNFVTFLTNSKQRGFCWAE